MSLIDNISFVLTFTTIIVFTMAFITSSLGQSSKLYVFLDTFSKSSVIYIAGGIFLTYIFFKHNLDETKRTNTLRIQERSYINVMKAIHDYRNRAPKFINSLYFDFQKTDLVEDYSGVNDEWGTKVYISKLIFQAIEDLVESWGTVDKSSLSEWLATFTQWLHGKQIQKMWSVHKYSYNQVKTLPIINTVIEIINKNKIKTGDDLIKVTQMLSRDPRIIETLNKSIE
jgi:hypothetical protein